MVNIEEKNAGIAGVLSSIFDEESRHFFVQKSAKFKRTGYRSGARCKMEEFDKGATSPVNFSFPGSYGIKYPDKHNFQRTYYRASAPTQKEVEGHGFCGKMGRLFNRQC